jgi:hypothetical protein
MVLFGRVIKFYDLQVQYSITTTGAYSVHILFSGIVGAQSPIDLMVQSAAADLTRTYGYGAVKHSTAGVTSSIYVQTRDSYGNNVLVDPEVYPSGLEDISFELCSSVKDDPSRACFGGVEELSVSVTLSYGIGPPGSDETAYGLYRLSYYPFTYGVFTPLVRHNNSLVVCLFDTSGLPEAGNPGPDEVDNCILQAEKGFSKTRRLFSTPSTRSQESGLLGIRNVEMIVNTTFNEPELQSARRLTLLAPIMAAVIGVIVDLFYGFVIPELKKKIRKPRWILFADSDTSSAAERYYGICL